MSSSAQDTMAGCPSSSSSSSSVPTKEANPETTLGSAYSPVDYMSITSFPRLPEDDMMSMDNAAKLRSKDDDNVLSEQDTDPDLFLKTARLRRLPSSASDLASNDVASLRETNADPFTEGCACQRDGLTVIITACLTFATAVTVALIMQIYFGDPQVFHQGAVVTDVAHCTALGRDVLGKMGSSVDAAIAAALCLGVVHPHTSGVGGGGVMLVHNSRKNETRVIDFRETAPWGLQEEMLHTDLDVNPGLLVGVPGMLSGLHQAHQLYGRMPWKDVVMMAADVARDGFNVTHDLAEALAKVKAANVSSSSFRDLFLPGGQPPLPGLFSRRLDLAAVLDTVAHEGVSAFYTGNLTREMAAAVQANGGVLVEEDFANYSSVVEQPAEVTYQGHHVMAAPAPHAGVALVTALNILEGFNISSHMSRNSTYHWIAEAVKIALGLASELGDPLYDSSVSDIVSKMLSKSEASSLRQMISDTQTFPAEHYTPTFSLQGGATAAQVMVMGPDDIIVSIMSSLNRPFGSGIVTPSGVLLNSQILDFSWPNKTDNLSPNPHNNIQRGKRPMSFLMPTAVRPALGMCGTYLAVGSSNADKALSGITQVLMNVLSLRINMSESLAFGRLHPQLQPDTLLVDAEFLEEDVELLQAKGHKVERLELLSVVDGTRRSNDLISGVNDPRSVDASALVLSKTS